MRGTGEPVLVIGGGLAGCEAAWQLAVRDIPVCLVEMKPGERTPAHGLETLAELVCSNSLRGDDSTQAVGLLKEELQSLGSLLIALARKHAVPAGKALAVDRHRFSRAVEDRLAAHPLITIERRRVEGLIPDRLQIVATGPLTAGPLADDLARHGALLHYHDAIAPLVTADSLDRAQIFRASRWSEEEGDYLNCPLDAGRYRVFVEALIAADKAPLHDFETAPFFEGCLPVEEMAARGPLTLAHGPLRPIGLVDPRTGRWPFAVVQLRAEDRARTAYNLVGFQTRLKRSEQERVFRLIPGLERAVFVRHGQVHRNTFVDAPRVLDEHLSLLGRGEVFLAGQLTGVEGYVESMASGLYAGVQVAARVRGLSLKVPPLATALGGLLGHLRRPGGSFQPSNVVWAMIEHPARARRETKADARQRAVRAARTALAAWRAEHQALFPDQE